MTPIRLKVMETSIECGLVGGIGGNIDIQLNTHAKYAGFILVSYDLVLISIKYSDLCHIYIVIVLAPPPPYGKSWQRRFPNS